MKLSRITFALLMLFAFSALNASTANAQLLGGIFNKTKNKTKESENQIKPKTADNRTPKYDGETRADDDSDARSANAKKLAKAAGMPKAANADAALNKLLFQAADDHRLIPRRVVVVDKDWLVTTGAHDAKVRRIFAVLGRTLDDGSGKCGKQMVQFDQDWKADKNAWGLIYVQNVGEITAIACGAIGK